MSTRSLKAIEQPIDTSTATGKCFLDMLGMFAEFETNLRKERQLEGIASAKAAGVKGRPAKIDAAKVREMKDRGLGPSEIAKALGIGRRASIACWKPARNNSRHNALVVGGADSDDRAAGKYAAGTS